MQSYIQHLHSDIQEATVNASFPYISQDLDLCDWLSDEEENKTARIRNLQEWTGIEEEMLPPAKMLDDEQVHELLEALKKMLDAYNCSFVLQIAVPERIQYECIRQNFDQEVKVKQWHMGFFELCKQGTEHKECSLVEYCHWAFFQEFFSNFSAEERTPEEERASMLQIEIQHLRRKYDDDWMKYYPYHLDPEYDDENREPFNYGFDDEDDEDNDDWWKK